MRSTRIVAIDGRSGAGKSTFARALADAIAAPVVSLEDLYDGWHGLRAGIDRAANDVLSVLARTGTALVPRYNWWRARWDPPWELHAADALIIEGVGAGSRAIAAYADLVVWLELDEPMRRRHALARDDGLFEPFWEMWSEQEEALLADEQTPLRADIVLDASSMLDGLVDPPGAPAAVDVRHTVRVLLADPTAHVLLLEVRDPATGRRAWSAPGGGIEPGEHARAAARREVAEETGLTSLALGPEVWRRHEAVDWDGRALSYHERWFLARVPRFVPSFAGLVGNERSQVLRWCWWDPSRLAAGGEPTVPPDLAARAAELLADGPPPRPEYR